METNRKFGSMLESVGTQVKRVSFPESRHGFTVRMLDDWWKAQETIIDEINKMTP